MEKEGPKGEEFVYRVSTAEEWEELRMSGATLGRDLDRTTRCIHLSNLHQVRMVLMNYFKERKDLYLLQIDASKAQRKRLASKSKRATCEATISVPTRKCHK